MSLYMSVCVSKAHFLALAVKRVGHPLIQCFVFRASISDDT